MKRAIVLSLMALVAGSADACGDHFILWKIAGMGFYLPAETFDSLIKCENGADWWSKKNPRLLFVCLPEGVAP